MSRPRRPRINLPESELTYRFSRSSGPGGQSVNTTDSRVEMLWSLATSAALDDSEKALAFERLRGRLTDGVIRVVSTEYKSQHRNREAAKVRLEELVAAAIIPPKPRHQTKPSRASRERRMTAKKRRSDVKRGRRGGWD